MTTSQESPSTPISAGGYRYNPDDPQDVADFADASVDELEQYERDQPGLDFSAHPAMVARDAEPVPDRKLIAWATTSTSLGGTDAGILVTSVDREDATDVQQIVDQVGDIPDAEYGMNETAADELLAGIGYRRTEPWIASGGQWAAEVERPS